MNLSFARSVCTLALACAAAIPQSQEADRLLEHGKQALFNNGARPALPEIERALRLYRQYGDRRGEAVALGYVGLAQSKLGNYSLAVELLEQALDMKRRLGDRAEQGRTLVNLGLTFWEQGNYSRAVQELTQAATLARAIGDRQMEGAALNNLGRCHDDMAEFQRSLNEYQQALTLHRSTGFIRGETDTLGNLGGRYILLGRYRDALPYYEQALRLDEKQNMKPSMSLDLGNMALCYSALGRTAESLATFDRALALAGEAGQKKQASDWHKGKGTALLRSGKYDAALAEYRLAAQVYEQAGLQRELVEALQDLGNIHVLLGDIGSAETEFRRATDTAQRIGNGYGVTTSLVALGGIELHRKRYSEAIARYQEALARARQAEMSGSVAEILVQLARADREAGQVEEALRATRQALELSRTHGMRPLESRALYELGEAERASGRSQTALGNFDLGNRIAQAVNDPDLSWRFAYAQGQTLETLNHPGDAVSAYERAVGVIESVRSQLREDRFRAGYLEDKYEVYVALVRLLLKLGRISPAFHYAERLRAQSYAALLGDVAPRAHSSAERELREQIRHLQKSIDEENANGSVRRAGKVEAYSAELAQAERAYQNLLDDLRATDSEYAAARSLATPPPETLQRLLPADTAVLEYVDAGESLIIFVMTAGALNATSVSVRRLDLESKVELLRDLISRGHSDDWRGPASSLRRMLIDPVERAGWLKGIARLYIVPHGVLHYIPYAVLPGSRYLIEDYIISYLPSAAALALPEREDAPGALLAAAPALARLPYAAEEARAVGALFSKDTDVLLGAKATETSFKRDAGRYRILHLATHGYLNRMNPLLSSLALQPDETNDGRLEVHEILDLRLRARLVTLSACNTALGSGYFADVPAGEEFIGLTRAFLFAGSRNVLATLWEVSDRPGLDFMRTFYGLLSAQGAARALAEAQRKAIHSNRNQQPYFWAPFILVGP